MVSVGKMWGTLYLFFVFFPKWYTFCLLFYIHLQLDQLMMNTPISDLYLGSRVLSMRPATNSSGIEVESALFLDFNFTSEEEDIYDMLSSALNMWVCQQEGILGPGSIQRCRLTSKGNPMLKIRRSHDRIIFDMGISMPGKDGPYIETRLASISLAVAFFFINRD